MAENTMASVGAYERIARLAVIGSVALLGVGVCWSLLGLYADGSFVLLKQLTTKTFWLSSPARASAGINDPARIFANCATQALVVIALQAGVQNLKLLIYLQTIGLTLPLVFWIATLALLKASDLFWLFVFAFIASFLTSGFAITGEYNLAVALTVFSAAILLRREKMELWAAIALFACAIVLVRSYESIVFLGPLLILFCAVRLFAARDGILQKTAIAIAIILYALGGALAVYSIRHPVDPNLLTGALSFGPFKSKHFHTLLGIGAFALSAAVLRGRNWIIASGLGCILVAIYLLNPNWWSQPPMQYYYRTISGVMVFGALALGGIAVVAARKGFRFNLSKAAPLVMATFLVTYGSFFHHLFGFRAWLTQFENEIAARRGVVPIEATSLQPSPYGWMWSNPSLSAVLKGRSSGAIIANDSRHLGWEPFPASETPVVPFDKSSPIF